MVLDQGGSYLQIHHKSLPVVRKLMKATGEAIKAMRMPITVKADSGASGGKEADRSSEATGYSAEASDNNAEADERSAEAIQRNAEVKEYNAGVIKLSSEAVGKCSEVDNDRSMLYLKKEN
ncbi:MAG: hypothetical protein NTW82_05025 [Bacteroidia bacterium]|nr:hypothetical protein [Bacteroidia bacterium]